MIRFALLFVLVLAAPSLAQERVLVTSFRVAAPQFVALGGEAADVLATSLPRAMTAAPKTVVVQELLLRNWTEPLTFAQQATLAAHLKSPSIARGALLVTYPRARVRTAHIELAVELIDSADHSVLGGAAETADVKLTGELSTHAERVAQTVRELVAKVGPKLTRAPRFTGKVLVAEQTGDIHLNIGHRKGVRRGMVLAVTRTQPDEVTRQPRAFPVGELVVRATDEFTSVARGATRDVTVQTLDTVTQIVVLKLSKELLALVRS